MEENQGLAFLFVNLHGYIFNFKSVVGKDLTKATSCPGLSSTIPSTIMPFAESHSSFNFIQKNKGKNGKDCGGNPSQVKPPPMARPIPATTQRLAAVVNPLTVALPRRMVPAPKNQSH